MVWTQQTAQAATALDSVVAARSRLLLPAHVPVEFATTLLRLERRRRITSKDVEAIEGALVTLQPEVVAFADDWREGLQLARRMGLSETFDATCLAVARRYDAEFWTCDRRFANAATAAGLDGFRLFD